MDDDFAAAAWIDGEFGAEEAAEAATKLEARSTKDNEDPDEERHLGWMTTLQRLHGSMESLVLKKQKKTFQ